MDEETFQPDACGAAPWTLLGRGTAAGKALFSLYNPQNIHGKAAGMHYSHRNRQQLSTKPAPAPKQEVTEKPKPKRKVPVPHFKRSQSSSNGGSSKLAQLPRRRTQEQIAATMAAEAEQAWRAPAPVPSGRLIDAQEKERCALLMQYKGNIPCSQLTAAGKAKAAAAAAAAQGCTHTDMQQAANDSSSLISRRRLLQQSFQELTAEVEECEQFISSMQSLGKLQAEHTNIVRAEVAAKVKQMGQLILQIKELDKQLRLTGSSSC